MVTINNAKITKSEVASAAKDAGVSRAQLAEMATQLASMANQMTFGDGQGLKELATVVAQAASSLGQSTQQGGGFEPSPGATAPPGT